LKISYFNVNIYLGLNKEDKMKKIILTLLVFLTMVEIPIVSGKSGKHLGEQRMFTVNIDFKNPAGKTITNSNGVFYHFYGSVYHENKIYIPEYWGEYPLYFVGEPAYITVTVTNNGPRAKAKIRIRTESYVLNPDGSKGISLVNPGTIDAEVAKGETKNIDATFTIQNQPGMESGLDLFVVKVLHINEGNVKEDHEPGLIMIKRGVFCPHKN
jgi:hypothetical protein